MTALLPALPLAGALAMLLTPRSWRLWIDRLAALATAVAAVALAALPQGPVQADGVATTMGLVIGGLGGVAACLTDRPAPQTLAALAFALLAVLATEPTTALLALTGLALASAAEADERRIEALMIGVALIWLGLTITRLALPDPRLAVLAGLAYAGGGGLLADLFPLGGAARRDARLTLASFAPLIVLLRLAALSAPTGEALAGLGLAALLLASLRLVRRPHADRVALTLAVQNGVAAIAFGLAAPAAGLLQLALLGVVATAFAERHVAVAPASLAITSLALAPGLFATVTATLRLAPSLAAPLLLGLAANAWSLTEGPIGRPPPALAIALALALALALLLPKLVAS